jgi:hypothetical protein
MYGGSSVAARSAMRCDAVHCDTWRRGVLHTPATHNSVSRREPDAVRCTAWRRGVSHTPAMKRNVNRLGRDESVVAHGVGAYRIRPR